MTRSILNLLVLGFLGFGLQFANAADQTSCLILAKDVNGLKTARDKFCMTTHSTAGLPTGFYDLTFYADMNRTALRGTLPNIQPFANISYRLKVQPTDSELNLVSADRPFPGVNETVYSKAFVNARFITIKRTGNTSEGKETGTVEMGGYDGNPLKLFYRVE